ncbi:hypothetical protein BJ508DRAFT_414926 [Ascobolus immersus RN42]|uniref:Uncharacterized protein n=1 Tax=Ascobolus immersus RN42 TaxID=1160509 RepID=A0A3N4IAW3_ASCIM|nr:hypothetical protein BJ508DRAFT_414926 [Ascobolus immersus RN42]
MGKYDAKYTAACFFTVLAGLLWLVFTTIAFCCILLFFTLVLHLYCSVFPRLERAFPNSSRKPGSLHENQPTVLRFAPANGRSDCEQIKLTEAYATAPPGSTPHTANPGPQPTGNAAVFSFPPTPDDEADFKAEGFAADFDNIKGSATGKKMKKRKGRWAWDYYYGSVKQRFNRTRFVIGISVGVFLGSLVGSALLGWVLFGIAVPRLKESGKGKKVE